MKVTVPRNTRDARPPVATHAAPIPGTVTRPSVAVRPLIASVIWDDGTTGVPPDAAYVRRFWTALLGPTAVVDLLRLITAARKKTPVPRPFRLPQLAVEGLVSLQAGKVHVRATIPPLAPSQTRRLPPALRTEHDQALATLLRSGDAPRE